MSQKYEVPLVMEGDHLSTPELWLLGEQRCKHPGQRVSQSGGEPIQ